MVPTLTVNMDVRCKRCKRKGAIEETGICLPCASKLVIANLKKQKKKADI